MFFNLILPVILLCWITCGALICLCAKEFLQINVSLPKIIVAMVVGPFAMNRQWMLSKQGES